MSRSPHLDVSGRKWGVWFLLSLLFLWTDVATAQMTATNIAGLRKVVTSEQGNLCAFTLDGLILDVDNKSGTLFFQDDSGVESLEFQLRGLKLEPGQRIRIYGTNYVARGDCGLSLGTRPIVDVDNAHSPIERKATLFLTAGRHPIEVKWFNWVGPVELKVTFSGPHLARQPIPDHALWHTETGSEGEAVRDGKGLKYRCFEGQWERLPDFERLTPTRTGVVHNFDVEVRTRPENAGVDFKGFLDIAEQGEYTFYLTSDDGGQLFLCFNPPDIRLIGNAPVPVPQPIDAGQTFGWQSLWAETEGSVTFLGQYRHGAELELTSGKNRMRVELLNVPPQLPWYLLHSRVRVRGICSGIHDIDGQKYAGSILSADWQSLRVLEIASQEWSAFKDGTISELRRTSSVPGDGIVHLRGRLRSDGTAQGMKFEDETGAASIELLKGSSAEVDTGIECLCRWTQDGTNIFLREAIGRELSDAAGGRASPPRLLATAMQVQQLKPDEALREYPVEILGTVTEVGGTSFVIQDFTHAVYVDVGEASVLVLPHVGDFCRVKGITRPGDFSPIVVLREATVLGKGWMPEPIHPTRDQLLSGSLDAQYVELRGLVTGKQDSYVTLLTSEGLLNLVIIPAPSEPWEKFLNAIIRVRGCFFAHWDKETHHVILDRPISRIGAATVSVDVPAPSDLFQAEKVPARELLQFDVRSDMFRRVKITGQIVHRSQDLYYLMDGTTGLRFGLAQDVILAPGDEVEVAGLVELGGPSPVLRQAVARKTGHSPLPKARQITLDSLSDSYDSTMVQLDGTLVDLKNRGLEQILEMQVGLKSFAVRLTADPGAPDVWEIGSRLRLNGVFHTLDGNQMASRNVNSFELLLNSPADVQVLARPPLWTLGRLLVIVALLLIGLTLAFVWINLLRREVERRTLQLHREISERERTEKWRAIEQERSRIARDLHDDLGSKLTEISMLATTSPGLKIGPQGAMDRLEEIAQTSRTMTAALEGVVWVINSRNDTLSSLIEYLASVAEEFLDKAGIGCRVELPSACPERMITAETRHDVLLSVREALNNAVRHGHPTEVLLRVEASAESLEIRIQDNGCGFELGKTKGQGLENLNQRMTKLKGVCTIQSSPGCGATVILKLPFPQEPRKNGSQDN